MTRKPVYYAALVLSLVGGVAAVWLGRFGLAEAPTEAPPDSGSLQTWWHPNSELNDATPVGAGMIRRSTHYDVHVASHSSPQTLHPAFTYMSLPRSGREKEGYTHEDGAEFADEADLTMSWSSFLYGADTWVQIELKQGPPLTSVDEVIIRPSTLHFDKELVNERTVRVLVPYAGAGFRFSVEFRSRQLTSYLGPAGGLTTRAEGNPAVHAEPRDALLIFAEPIPAGEDSSRLVPDPSKQSIHYPQEGALEDLEHVTQEVLYFRPGTYYMGWNRHALLPPTVRWVYLAPGAYVKGAFQFPRGQSDFKVTGFGVLSGEQYVYEPDRDNAYRHRPPERVDCHRSCVKMLEFDAGPDQQHLTLHGITLVEPPYHSFVVYGHEQAFKMDVARFKQLGGWYWQTDGLELYQGSAMRDSFFHSNDDVLKLYASGLKVERIVVWKGENGPVIQWGWRPRDIDGVNVNGVDVIHNRMYWKAHNSCIVNSAMHYLDPESARLADPRRWIRNLLLENIRSEGLNLCAMRLFAMSSWEDIHIKNLWIEQWNQLAPATQASRFEALTNEAGEQVIIGNEVQEGRGLAIENYVVGEERVRKAGDNWRADQTGRLAFDPRLWPNWNAW